MKKIILSAFLCFSILSSIVAQVDFTNDYTTPSCPDVTINFQYTGDYPDAMFYYWDFGDGIGTDFGINTNISYTYVLSGTFMVDLYVMDFNYNLISFTQSPITILGDAHTITANPYFANINDDINFNLEGDPTPSTLLWTFGDGTNSSNINPSHSYSTDGTYTVTAFYESSCGSSETSTEVYISDINFTYNSIDSCPNSNINFQYYGTTPNAFYYWWDFGDGNNSGDLNPVYAYSQPGVYIVNLVVFDDQDNVLGGHTDTVTVLGDVYTLVANPPYTNANTPIQFTLQGEQTPTNVVWDFGDGNSSSELSPTHQFAVSGQYFVSATVTGDCGNIIYTNSVYISDVDYSYTISSNCSPAEVTFQYTGSEIDAFYYTWEFGNNNTSCCDVTSPTTSYTLGGTYTPTLTVFDQNWNILGVMSKEIVIGTSLNNEIFVTSCVPYTWNGQTYTESGIYTYNGTSQSLCDSIVNLHLTIQNYLETIQNVNACQSFTWNENGMTYTNSGSYSETYTSVFGCDSIVTLNLNIGFPSNSSLNVEVCNSYTWNANNETYTESGIYTAVLPNSFSCDSTITLNLTISTPYNSTENINACNFYTWPVNGQPYFTSGTYTENLVAANGCDSIITLNLNIGYMSFGNETIESCEPVFWDADNQLYIETGIYTATLVNALGCDSIATLNLTINNVDNTVSVSGTTISSNEIDATYQWLDCSNGNSPISGETNASFIPTQNGIYAVEVTKNSCSETSDCITINSIGINDISFNKLNIYPNPTSDFVNIKGLDENAILNIKDIGGKLIVSKSISKSDIIDLSLQEKGVYYLTIVQNQTQMVYKIIKL